MVAQGGNVTEIPIGQDRVFRSALDASRDQLEQDRAQLVF
jgi:hypothetical protein